MLSSAIASDITEVAARLGLDPASIRRYGDDKAKIDHRIGAAGGAGASVGRLVLVSAMTPTPAGEGKTTTSIGLADGLRHLGRRACVALREPSLGPCFGLKGVGTGFGRARLVPTADINLHFTGDFHALTSAHDLLAALVDNHLHQRHEPALDPARVTWRRVLDVNDRALRSVQLGGGHNGPARTGGFDITAASEIMAILALATSAADLRARLARTVVGYGPDGEIVTAREIGAVGAMMALLRDAIDPNLVQSAEGTPALVHCGPFANIAHGVCSVMAIRAGMSLAEWTVVEAGFGFDLGGEKFFDLVCPAGGFAPAAVVVVATVRALKMHGGRAVVDLAAPAPAAVERGLPNLARHLTGVARFGRPAVVAINRFDGDGDDELAVIRSFCQARAVPAAVITATRDGAPGAAALADLVIDHALASPVRPSPVLYPADAPLPAKLDAIARTLYGARGVVLSDEARAGLAELERTGFAHLPVCVAKTQASFTDDPTRLGAPDDFDITIRRLQLAAGAGFVVAMAGSIVRMPGLPAHPRALDIDLDDVTGEITGLA